MGVVVAMLRGEKNKSIWERQMRDMMYGVGKGKTKVFWVALVRELVSRGVLCEIKQSANFGGSKFMNTWAGLGVTPKGHKFSRGLEKMMAKARGDLREKVKKVAVITPRFGAESTPADQARSGLYSVLVKETLAKSQSSNNTAKITYYADQFMKVIDRFWVEENIETDLFPPQGRGGGRGECAGCHHA